jgi:dTDP-4-dehydrorhamnose reductase
MRLLITGGAGDLGRPLSKLVITHHETTTTWFQSPAIGGGSPVQIDLTDGDAVHNLLHALKPDAIIHTAISDRGPDMRTTIPTAARNLAYAAQRVGAHLTFLSTDCVFDGIHAPYTEDIPPAPTTPYGTAKAEAEQIVASECLNSMVVRTSLIYDFTPANRQVGWITNKLADGETVTLFTDELRHPIWATNLAGALIEIAARRMTGILHVAGPEALSRYDYGLRLLHAAGIDPRDRIVPGLAEEIVSSRVRDLRLCLDRAEQVLDIPLLTIEEAATAANAPGTSLPR